MANRNALVIVSGAIKETPSPDDLLFGGGLVKQSVSAGNTATIPSGYSMTLAGPYTVAGTLSTSGALVIL